jgi:hypothetical protein
MFISRQKSWCDLGKDSKGAQVPVGPASQAFTPYHLVVASLWMTFTSHDIAQLLPFVVSLAETYAHQLHLRAFAAECESGVRLSVMLA